MIKLGIEPLDYPFFEAGFVGWQDVQDVETVFSESAAVYRYDSASLIPSILKSWVTRPTAGGSCF